MKKQKQNKKENILPKTVIIMLASLAVLAIVFWVQIKNYEDGIIDVYATQQDAYVQLVLDQINIKDNRDNEEIINEILSSLDSSTNKYWTFSDAKSMLFVKDVLETNKYKALTAESYFINDNSRSFIDTLKLNRVSHADITIDSRDYVVSGVAFEYNNETYKLCLLTNKDTLLDNNNFLGSKVLMCTMVAIVLIFTFLCTTITASKYQKVLDKNNEATQNVSELQVNIAELNDALREKHSRDTKQKIWSEDLLPSFMGRFKERMISPVSLIIVECDSEEAKKDFLAGANITLDESVLRFENGNNNVLIVGLEINARNLAESVRPCIVKGSKMLKRLDIISVKDLNMDTVNKFLKES